MAHQQLADLSVVGLLVGLVVGHGRLSPQPAPGLKQGGATAMGAILPPLFHLHEGDPTGVGLPLIAAVVAMNSIFSHDSERGLFLTLHGLMGLAQAMDHEAIGRIAHQVLAVADGVDGGPARGSKNSAFELHLISLADLTVVGTWRSGNPCKRALCAGLTQSTGSQ